MERHYQLLSSYYLLSVLGGWGGIFLLLNLLAALGEKGTDDGVSSPCSGYTGSFLDPSWVVVLGGVCSCRAPSSHFIGTMPQSYLFEVRRPRKCLEADGYGGDGTEQRGFELCPRREAEGGIHWVTIFCGCLLRILFFYSH